MIELQIEQGTDEWRKARSGIPTASAFDNIVTPKGALSASRVGYMHKLLAEWLLDMPLDDFEGNYWTERGHTLEPQAREYYQIKRGYTPRQVGLVYRDDTRLVSCSPDWLIDSVGVGEVKCPSAGVHVGYLRGQAVPGKYKPQTQGQLWVCHECEWLDFVSYYPGLPASVVRVERDAEFQKKLDDAIPAFIQEMLEARKQLESERIAV